MNSKLSSDYIYQRSLQASRIIGSFVTPILLLPNKEADSSEILDSATASLVEIGGKKLIVTCNHVWKKFEELKNENSETILCMAGGIILNDAHVVDSGGSAIDLAVLEPVNSSLIESIDKRFYKSSKWPPPRAREEEYIWFIGYPGGIRQSEQGKIMTNSLLFVDSIRSVSDRHFVLVDCEFERQEQYFYSNLPLLEFLGGLSGSPVFAYRRESFDLVGFIYESSPSPEKAKNATFFVAHIFFISQNGTLDRLAIPWS